MLLPAQIIQKKRDGKALTEEEIQFFVSGFTSGELPEYQMSALSMAICLLRVAISDAPGLLPASSGAG